MTGEFMRLAIAGLTALVLGGCTSVETKGLAKCSGLDRRPMNQDLWTWQETTPSDTPASKEDETKPLSFARTKELDADLAAVAAIDAATSPRSPAWNVAASEQPCEGGPR